MVSRSLMAITLQLRLQLFLVTFVLNGITGSIGLAPTLSALAVGNKVALANKESLVAGGDLVMKYGSDRIIPVDSEHSAIFQALLAGRLSDVKQPDSDCKWWTIS